MKTVQLDTRIKRILRRAEQLEAEQEAAVKEELETSINNITNLDTFVGFFTEEEQARS